MNSQFFISLLNPAVGLLLAAAFFVLWLYQREKRHVAVIAVGYMLSAAGFVLQDIGPGAITNAHRIVSNACFLLAGFCMADAVISRYGRPVPHIGLGLLAAAGMASLLWFFFVTPDLTGRIYSINFALGGIALLVAVSIRSAPKRHLIDHIVFAVCLLAAANFVVRTIVILKLGGPYATYDGFRESAYWTSVQVSHVLISLMLALSLVVATTLDLVTKLKEDSLTDELSGLLNRRGFDEAASALLAKSRAGGRPAALVLADLDHFKAVNDTYGHEAGDRAIVAFAELLKGFVGPNATVGRVGGEEFAAFMANTTQPSAKLFSEGVRAAYAATSIPGLEGVRLTASFGVSMLGEEDSLADLTRRADEALYRAKREGRDCVRIAPSPAEGAAGSMLAWT